jgi:hypothetical protein
VIGEAERWKKSGIRPRIFLIGDVGIQQEEALYVWTP